MSVYKRGSKWCFDFWIDGKRYRGAIPEARVKAQAERAENAIRDQVYEGRYGKKQAAAPLLRDFVTNTFLPWSRANKRTWREDVYRSQSILAFFGKYRLDEISSAQIEKFKMKRQQTPTKNGSERRPATVNRELENLSRMFNLAIDMGIPLINPCLKVQSLSEDNERNRYLSDAEERRLLDVLQGRRKHLRSIVLIDLQTGLRKRELLSLRWQNVDFERDVIQVMNSRRERTKSGRSRSVPLTSIAREELLALHKESGWSEYVFVNSKTFKPLTDVKKAFTSALSKAGIEDFHFHDLRHTCATRLGDRGASAFEIAQIMGWSDIRMAMRYTHATCDGIRRAMHLLTQTGVGNGKVVQLQNWTDTKVPTLNGNGQHELPVSA